AGAVVGDDSQPAAMGRSRVDRFGGVFQPGKVPNLSKATDLARGGIERFGDSRRRVIRAAFEQGSNKKALNEIVVLINRHPEAGHAGDCSVGTWLHGKDDLVHRRAKRKPDLLHRISENLEVDSGDT